MGFFKNIFGNSVCFGFILKNQNKSNCCSNEESTEENTNAFVVKPFYIKCLSGNTSKKDTKKTKILYTISVASRQFHKKKIPSGSQSRPSTTFCSNRPSRTFIRMLLLLKKVFQQIHNCISNAIFRHSRSLKLPLRVKFVDNSPKHPGIYEEIWKFFTKVRNRINVTNFFVPQNFESEKLFFDP